MTEINKTCVVCGVETTGSVLCVPCRREIEQEYNPYDLKPGQILIFKKKDGFDPVGSFVTAEQRDTDVSHAALVGKNGEIWTTGAIRKFGLPNFFGAADPSEYLKGRDFYICEFDTLTPEQMNIIQENAERMTGMFYGFHKIAMLVLKARRGGTVHRLWPWLTKEVKNPFCSEAVADCFWKAGLRVCEVNGSCERWKDEASAITPANLKTYAEMKGTPLQIIRVVDQ